jgi:hypothetical protein
MDWPGGSWQATAAIVGTLAAIYFFILWLCLVVWTYLDIRARTRLIPLQAAAVLVVLFFNLAGLFVYLILRPKETLAEAYDRSLEEEAILADLQNRPACPECGHPTGEDYIVCPNCATRLREPCTSCQRPLRPAWLACPFCGVTRRPTTPTRRSRVRPEPAVATAPSAPVATAEAESVPVVAPGDPFAAIIGDGNHGNGTTPDGDGLSAEPIPPAKRERASEQA